MRLTIGKLYKCKFNLIVYPTVNNATHAIKWVENIDKRLVESNAIIDDLVHRRPESRMFYWRERIDSHVNCSNPEHLMLLLEKTEKNEKVFLKFLFAELFVGWIIYKPWLGLIRY